MLVGARRTRYKRMYQREYEAVLLLLQGMTNKEIAGQMRITERTVKVYLQNVYDLLGVPECRHKRVVLTRWFNCELFREGLRFLELLPQSVS